VSYFDRHFDALLLSGCWSVARSADNELCDIVRGLQVNSLIARECRLEAMSGR